MQITIYTKQGNEITIESNQCEVVIGESTDINPVTEDPEQTSEIDCPENC